MVAAGVILHEVLAAYEALKQEGIVLRVIDLYSVKPLDVKTLPAAARETGHAIGVEEHYSSGGLGEAVAAELSNEEEAVHIMADEKIPMSGQPLELFDYERIARQAIIRKVKALR